MSIVTYPVVFAWVFQDPVRYKREVPYKKNQGAVIWTKLSEDDKNSLVKMQHVDKVIDEEEKLLAEKAA